VRRELLIRYAAIGAGAAVVVAVAIAAFLSMQQPFQLPTASPTTSPCAPHPCADVRGFNLWVSNLKIDSGVVSMQLTFRNSSASTHADPSEIQLIDSTGHPNQRITDAPGCTAWARTDFNHGAQFGPVAECFRPSSTDPPMKLHWEPDFGFFCCETDIALTP
jgi:hypothetical protein